eukprot:GEMP01032254.1.p1 GENE.GEMP01032254.1~~GEMP01032254.1.p1  ORF type:complete len:164 (+),score=49.90 GEMP01032254.1:45-536(+)
MSDDEPTFEGADAGASHTFPMQAGALRKGGHCMLKGKPCKLVEITTSKTGKHGHAKAHLVGICIFTSKKCEDLCPTSHNMEVPNVKRDEYTLLDCNEADGTLSLLTESGETKDDLNLPRTTEGQYEDVSNECIKLFNDGKGVICTVIGACGDEKLISVRESST